MSLTMVFFERLAAFSIWPFLNSEADCESSGSSVKFAAASAIRLNFPILVTVLHIAVNFGTSIAFLMLFRSTRLFSATKSLQGSVQKRNMLKAESRVLRFYLFWNTEYIGKWHQKYRMYRNQVENTERTVNYELFIKPSDVLNGKCNIFYSALEA
ncbi:hypothetical protein T01_1296 [Trichinella spiralis]|uniref:Uncharacterized protein n=1 Tax=Trichinella spiralis TaxID=6334 RepID=A0A0V1B7V1_TRISP|nr:hypothetical protein T01_1296 [Trichinella spiralis]